MREGTRTSLPSPPLLFIAFSTPHRSPLSERLEQASNEPVSINHGLRTTDYRLCIKQGLGITFGPRTMILKIELIISK